MFYIDYYYHSLSEAHNKYYIEDFDCYDFSYIL